MKALSVALSKCPLLSAMKTFHSFRVSVSFFACLHMMENKNRREPHFMHACFPENVFTVKLYYKDILWVEIIEIVKILESEIPIRVD